jgi:hypothetical protein
LEIGRGFSRQRGGVLEAERTAAGHVASSLFGLFVAFGPILGSTDALLALRPLLDGIAPSLAPFPRAVVVNFVQVFAADLQGKATCECGVCAALRTYSRSCRSTSLSFSPTQSDGQRGGLGSQ